MISKLNNKYKSLFIFAISTTLVYYALSKFNLNYMESFSISLIVIVLCLLKININLKKEYKSTLNQNLSLSNKLSDFNTKLDDQFKKINQQLTDLSQKKQSNQSINDFPAINLSIISSFNKEDTYILDDKEDNSLSSNSQNIVLKRLKSLLKKNGQTLKKLKPFNKKTFEKISTNSLPDDDDFININFPTNLINSN